MVVVVRVMEGMEVEHCKNIDYIIPPPLLPSLRCCTIGETHLEEQVVFAAEPVLVSALEGHISEQSVDVLSLSKLIQCIAVNLRHLIRVGRRVRTRYRQLPVSKKLGLHKHRTHLSLWRGISQIFFSQTKF